MNSSTSFILNPNLSLSQKYEQRLKQIFTWNSFRKVAAGPNFQMKSSLENMEKLSQIFDHPHKHFKIVHIAGTNGKGSVTLKTAVALQKYGFKTGLFTSPHVSCFRERIQINRAYITEEDVLSYSQQVIDALTEHQLHVTFFEIITMMAFLKFRDEKVDYAVLECGLGGRLDATNVVKPEVCGITSVGWDHMEALGDTLEKIATEKAGIIKPKVPIVVGIQTPHKVIEQIALERGSPFILAQTESQARDDEEVKLVKSDFKFMQNNNAVVVKILHEIEKINDIKFKPEDIHYALQQQQPCRMEKIDLSKLYNRFPKLQEQDSVKNIYLDVSHNLSAFEAVIDSLKENHKDCKITIVCGFSKMKDIHSMLEFMVKFSHKIYFIVQQHFKVASLKTLLEQAQTIEKGMNGHDSNIFQQIIDNGKINTTLGHAIENATDKEVILVCGSFYIMEDVREFFGIEEPHDPKTVNTV